MANEHHTNDDLDELLDSTLDDFKDLNLSQRKQREEEDENKKKKKEEEMGLLPSGEQGLDMRSKKFSKEDDHVAEKLDKLKEQSKETVNGLESSMSFKDQPASCDGGDDAMVEDFLKQFENVSGSTDVEIMVENVMQQLLSKDVLNEPMKEIGARYPKWLEENEATLSKEDYIRYSKQNRLINELIAVYDHEPSNSSKITEIMQKMQKYGQPPNDIVREMGPGFDSTSLGLMSPEMLQSSPNCCIM